MNDRPKNFAFIRSKALTVYALGCRTLTFEQAAQIRARYAPGLGGQLAREFGVSPSTVYRILHDPKAYDPITNRQLWMLGQPLVNYAPTMWRDADEDKFDDRILRTEDHWLWTGYVDPRDGYGRFKPRHNEPAQLAHRVAYVRWVGPIPDAFPVIDHVGHPWKYKRCVKPEHLEAITHEENIRLGQSPAGKNARLTNCPRCGDPLDDPAFATQRANGERRCLRCQRAEHARYRARKRASAASA